MHVCLTYRGHLDFRHHQLCIAHVVVEAEAGHLLRVLDGLCASHDYAAKDHKACTNRDTGQSMSVFMMSVSTVPREDTAPHCRGPEKWPPSSSNSLGEEGDHPEVTLDQACRALYLGYRDPTVYSNPI